MQKGSIRKAEEKSHVTHSVEQMKESSFSKHWRALQDKMLLEKIHSRQLYESLAFWFFPSDFFFRHCLQAKQNLIGAADSSIPIFVQKAQMMHLKQFVLHKVHKVTLSQEAPRAQRSHKTPHITCDSCSELSWTQGPRGR